MQFDLEAILSNNSIKVSIMTQPFVAKKTRIEYIDLAKGFCIVLVIANHLAMDMNFRLPFAEYLVTFRMPLYFFLSGCFFKTYEGFWGFTKRKINKLLVPFVFFYLTISCLIPRLAVDFFGAKWYCLPYSKFLTGFCTTGDGFPFGAIWFLLGLFIMNLIFYALHILASKTKYNIPVLIAGAILTIVLNQVFHDHLWFFVRSAFRNLLFFEFGYIAYRKTPIMKPNKLDKYLIFQIILAFALLVVIKDYCPDKYIVYYACGLLGLYGVLMLAKLLKHLPFFSYIGRYSIMLLVTHMLLLRIGLDILQHFSLPISVVFVIVLVATLASYYAIIPFMLRFMPRVTAQKDLIKVS